jgi:hypothetical protein
MGLLSRKPFNMKQFLHRIETTAVDFLPGFARHAIYLKTRAKIAST